MDSRYKKEGFETLKIKTSVAKKFRRYCRETSRSQSMTLFLMVEFFQNHGLSPEESLGPHAQTLENYIKKRFSAVIAIIKDIEKTQTKPTIGILQALLEQEEPKKKPLLVEKKRPSGDRPNYREFNR
jgi:hypothetical protein